MNQQPAAVPVAKVLQPSAVSPHSIQVRLVLFLVGLVLVGVVIVALNGGFVTRWEYKVVSFADSKLEAQMDALGRDGWELVYARRTSDPMYELIFKRRR